MLTEQERKERLAIAQKRLSRAVEGYARAAERVGPANWLARSLAKKIERLEAQEEALLALRGKCPDDKGTKKVR